MAKYLAYQIYVGNVDYEEAITKYPNLKDEIDTYLAGFNQE